MRSKQVELAYYMTSRNIDIALINETHLLNNHSFKIPGFEIYRKDRPLNVGQRPAGGVAIVIRQNIRHTEMALPDLNSIEALAIEVVIGGRKTAVAALYSRPQVNLQREDLDKLDKLGPRFIAAGDLNARHTHWNSNYCNKKGRDLLQHSNNKHYIVCATLEPTYYPFCKRYRPDVLDVALFKNIDTNFNLSVEIFLDSDHQPVTIELGSDVSMAEPRPIKNYSKADWRGFSYQIENRLGDPPTLNSPQEIDRNVDKLTAAIQAATSKNIPLIKPAPFRQNLPSDITKAITDKNRARKRWQRTGLDHHQVQLNQLQELVRQKISDFKNAEWNKKVEGLQVKDGSVWKMTKAFTGNKIIIPPLQTSNGRMVHTPLDKANALADVLEETFKPNTDPANDRHIVNVQRSVRVALAKKTNFAPKTTNIVEIKGIIRNLKNKKAPGPDSIQNTVLKHLPNSAVEHLSNIINSSFKLCYFPIAWKEAKILAFPKPGKEKKLPSNYRPISLLNTLSKIMEGVFLARLTKFINNNNLLPNEQFGFRAKHSTNHALMRMVEDITLGFNNNKTTVAAFLDVEKAFDRVWHDGLIFKLNRMKFPDCYVKLLASYLGGRQFAVEVKGTLSAKRPIRAGVPQGSLLGPVLYILYTHDFPKANQTKFGCFADDTAIYAESWAPKLALSRVQNHLTQLQDWLSKWRIKINIAKCEAIEFRRGRKTLDTRLTLFNSNIDWKEKVKYLGVQLDRKVLWGPHVANQVQKGYARLCQLYPILNRGSKLSKKSGLIVYKALIRPILLYAAPIWSCAAKSHIQKMQIIQNKVLRIIDNKGRRDIRVTELHRKYKIETIAQSVQLLAKKFFSTAETADNPLILALGDYDHTIHWKYKRPKMALR